MYERILTTQKVYTSTIRNIDSNYDGAKCLNIYIEVKDGEVLEYTRVVGNG